MKSKIALLISTVLLCSASLYASTTRDQGLGLGNYSWGIDNLQGYIYENPAYLDNYKDIAFFEHSGLSDGLNMGGVFYSPVRGFTFGLHFGYPVSNQVWNSKDKESLFHIDTYSMKGVSVVPYSTTPLQNFLGYQAALLENGEIIDLTDPVDGDYPVGTTAGTAKRNSLTQRNLSAIFSYVFDNWGVGASFGYATSWTDKKTGDVTGYYDEYKFINTEYSSTLGGYFNFSSILGLDAAVGCKLYGLENTYNKRLQGVDTSMSYKSSGAMDINASAQLKYSVTPVHKFHIRTAYQFLNRSTAGKMRIDNLNNTAYNVNAKDTFDRKGQIIELGFIDEIKLSPTVKAFMGFNTEYETFSNKYSGKDAITLANNMDKYDSKKTTVTLPLLVGLEAAMSENWTGRFGLSQVVYKPFKNSGKNITNSRTSAVSTPTTLDEDEGSSTTLNMGLSYKLGSFSFDWLANIDLFVDGPYMVSGKTTSVPMSTSFAATYSFDSLISKKSTADDLISVDSVSAEEKAKTVKPVDVKAKTAVKPVVKP